MTQYWRELGWRRGFERLVIFFFLFGTVLFIALIAQSGFIAAQTRPDPSILTFAYHMPNQGWAPLTVYFSAFGSRDLDGQIVRYEWDLDGNGSFETDTSETQGYTHYTYAKPGEYTVTLQVTDDEGGTATDSVLVRVRHPASSRVDYWTLFDDTRIQQITLIFSQENWTQMMAEPTSKLRVEGSAEIFGERLDHVSIGPRGNFTLNIAGEKIPWQIDTDNFIPGQEFHNLKQLLLTNNIADPAILGEKIAYDLLEFAGVPASHVSFVDVWIDIEDDAKPSTYWGLYTLVERVDMKYIGSRFGAESTGGTLYKTNHYRRGAGDLVYYGPTLDFYPQPHGVPLYDQRTDDGPTDYADLIQFLWVLDGETYSSSEEWAEAVEAVFDMDGYLRWLTVESAIMSWDIYPYTGNNYYLYYNPANKKWLWLPWDQTWGENTQQALFSLPADQPRLLNRAPLYDNLFEVPRYRQTFAAYTDLLTRTVFNEAAIGQVAQDYRDQIAPYLAAGDKAMVGEEAQQSLETFEASWTQLINLTSDRSEFLRNTLESDQETFLYTP